MGKGSNVQKKQQAQLRNQKNQGKTEEERKAARLKSEKDAAAFMCELCRQTFMSNAKPPLLYQHIIAKHPPGTELTACFPVHLKDFDPDDPKGEKKPKTEESGAPVKKKPVKKKDADLDTLLDAGLKKGKK